MPGPDYSALHLAYRHMQNNHLNVVYICVYIMCLERNPITVVFPKSDYLRACNFKIRFSERIYHLDCTSYPYEYNLPACEQDEQQCHMGTCK